MTSRADFRDGRVVRVADLNEELSGRETLLATHLELAHPPPWSADRLVGSSVTGPGSGPSLQFAATGTGSTVTVTLPNATAALRLGGPGGHSALADVRCTAAALVATDSFRFFSSRQAASGPSPWTVSARDQRGDGGDLTSRDLVVELEVLPGASVLDSRAAVGVTGTAFQPVLTIDAGGTVTVEGDVKVIGAASQGPIPPDLTDARFVAAINAVIAERIVAASLAGHGDAFAFTATEVGTSTLAQSDIEITLTPSEKLTLWAVAIEIRHGVQARFVLLARGNEAATGVDIDFATSIPWVPPLTGPIQDTVIVAAAAFDAQSELHTVFVDLSVGNGPPA